MIDLKTMKFIRIRGQNSYPALRPAVHVRNPERASAASYLFDAHALCIASLSHTPCYRLILIYCMHMRFSGLFLFIQ